MLWHPAPASSILPDCLLRQVGTAKQRGCANDSFAPLCLVESSSKPSTRHKRTCSPLLVCLGP